MCGGYKLCICPITFFAFGDNAPKRSEHVCYSGTRDSMYEGWNFNSDNYLFTTDTK